MAIDNYKLFQEPAILFSSGVILSLTYAAIGELYYSVQAYIKDNIFIEFNNISDSELNASAHYLHYSNSDEFYADLYQKIDRFILENLGEEPLIQSLLLRDMKVKEIRHLDWDRVVLHAHTSDGKYTKLELIAKS